MCENKIKKNIYGKCNLYCKYFIWFEQQEQQHNFVNQDIIIKI